MHKEIVLFGMCILLIAFVSSADAPKVHCIDKCGDGTCDVTEVKEGYPCNEDKNSCPKDCSKLECKETDSGLDPNKRGKTHWNNFDYKDYCAKGYEKNSITGESAEIGDLIEYSCTDEKGNSLCSYYSCVYKVIKCDEGRICKNGACVKPGFFSNINSWWAGLFGWN